MGFYTFIYKFSKNLRNNRITLFISLYSINYKQKVYVLIKISKSKLKVRAFKKWYDVE